MAGAHHAVPSQQRGKAAHKLRHGLAEDLQCRSVLMGGLARGACFDLSPARARSDLLRSAGREYVTHCFKAFCGRGERYGRCLRSQRTLHLRDANRMIERKSAALLAVLLRRSKLISGKLLKNWRAALKTVLQTIALPASCWHYHREVPPICRPNVAPRHPGAKNGLRGLCHHSDCAFAGPPAGSVPSGL